MLSELAGPYMERRVLCEVESGGRSWPVQAFLLGSTDTAAPAFGIFGGVHGLERIGAEVTIAYLRSLVMRLKWDVTLHKMLEMVRLVFVPLVNPGGMWLGTRANPNGVDLMRNAPIESSEHVPYLVGGQRISARLPWYRGLEGAPMERESAALCALVEKELLQRPFSIAVDCHSGFGLTDRLWFPFAHTRRPIGHLPELHAFAGILDESMPHHRYLLEPQSRQYLAHGDLWDHLYLMSAAGHPDNVFLPMTLEMGSWLWIKKNPRQFFSRHGIFNPVIEHRRQRVLRRHVAWLNFIARAVAGSMLWLPAKPLRPQHERAARARWYGGGLE